MKPPQTPCLILDPCHLTNKLCAEALSSEAAHQDIQIRASPERIIRCSAWETNVAFVQKLRAQSSAEGLNLKFRVAVRNQTGVWRLALKTEYYPAATKQASLRRSVRTQQKRVRGRLGTVS